MYDLILLVVSLLGLGEANASVDGGQSGGTTADVGVMILPGG